MKFTKRIEEAMKKAAILHDDQYRKDPKLPFIVHPISVMMILDEYTDDEDLLVAALLHDVLEDVKEYYEDDMRHEFGDRVTDIVKGVTEPKDPNKTAQENLPWRECKLGYMENLKNAPIESVMLAAADKIHNLISLKKTYRIHKEETWELFNSTADERVWYFDNVSAIIQDRLGDDSDLTRNLVTHCNEFRDLVT